MKPYIYKTKDQLDFLKLLLMEENLIKAEKEKELGNKDYYNKNFKSAFLHYKAAVSLNSRNMIYKNNLAAVYLEEENFEMCISTCLDAVETGRLHNGESKHIAKAFERIGTCYQKMADYFNAANFYYKSLAEYRNPHVVAKVQQVEKIMEQNQINVPVSNVSHEQKNAGNEFFKKGDYPAAMQCYTNAIQSSPNDPTLYSNRAACYAKLLEFSMAVQDCDHSIKLDPNFVKGHLRKGVYLLALRQFRPAADSFLKVHELDPNSKEAVEGYKKCLIEEHEEIRKNLIRS